MTEIFGDSAAKFRKHEFHIQGFGGNVVASIQSQLATLAERKTDLFPTTVIFLEVPTNPDMKIPDLPDLVAACVAYKEASGKEIMLLLDTTFAPGSKLMQKIRELSEDLGVLVFISMSKSVSRGLTTAGAVVANHTQMATEVLTDVGHTCETLDIAAKPDQLMRLVEHHARVEERCQKAYHVAETVGDSLRKVVHNITGEHMELAFVTPEQAAMGFTTSTFSFNLPSPPGATPEVNAALAQRFVDLLCAHPGFKPCVSFGQDNGLVYVTVPATSTQGAVKAEHKARQAVGGVQLVRLSFPPTCDVNEICRALSDSLFALYH